ncbi:MAG TPA: protein-disulfide reductase DsbD domain-containing protein, partial [Vicinamibacterales bacterium]|nr:protein-disulfide reductase DsbD domain-containing protein [Vicinamibacterales bacterium]
MQWTLAPAKGAAPAGPGGSIAIQATADIEAGWYIYAMTQAAGGPYALVIALPPSEMFSLGGVIQAPLTRRKFDENFKMETETHADRVTFAIPVRIAKAARPGAHTLQLSVTY